MNFCSNCGSNSISLSIPEGDNRERFVCGNCGTIHYQNPNIVAGCLPVWEDKVLLCRRAIEPRHGYWNIPSGYLENGESEIWSRGRKPGVRTLHRKEYPLGGDGLYLLYLYAPEIL